MAELSLTLAIVGFMSITFDPPLQAADCGANIPCACGDNVVASRTLVSSKTTSDPILNTVCTGDGLIMNVPGVTLDLNGKKLRGSGNGVGVRIAADGVTVRNGQVFTFGTGISGVTDGSTINKVKPYYNSGDGIFLDGNWNTVSASPARHNGNNGYAVFGDDNTITGTNNEYNGVDGIFVNGNGNDLIGNLASENNKKKSGGNGITVIGDGNTLEQNWITKKNTEGIAVTGDGNTLTANRVELQKSDGILVNGDGNILSDNSSNRNRGVGIKVVGDGDPTASTGNRVSLNNESPQCEIYEVTTSPTCIEQPAPF